MTDFLTVLIADDHPLFRGGLKEALRGDPSIQVVAEASDGMAALQQIEKLAPAVAVLDVDMPRMTGLDVARAVRDQQLPTRIVILTMHDEADFLQRALDLGVRGYVLKESVVSDILACVHYVASGQVYISPAMSGHLVAKREAAAKLPPTSNPVAKLTEAERRVVALIAGGKITKEIAVALGISPKTVENHRSNACAKLDIHGTNALVRFAIEHRAALE